MMQMESGYLSNALIDRSQVRLQRLPYIERCRARDDAGAGQPRPRGRRLQDQGRSAGSVRRQPGYSATYGVTLGGNFVHSNFMGTGNRPAVNLQGGKYQKVYDASDTDAYRTVDGLARQLSVS
jgi:outer membrane protein insertion porin family